MPDFELDGKHPSLYRDVKALLSGPSVCRVTWTADARHGNGRCFRKGVRPPG
jgi:hypothetical protein